MDLLGERKSRQHSQVLLLAKPSAGEVLICSLVYILIILTILINGCATKTVDTVTSDKIKDSIIHDKVVTTTIGKEPKDFNEFFKIFTTDSLFQIERVKFPWTIMTSGVGEDAPIKELIDKKDRKYSSFYYEGNYTTRRTDAYTQKIKSYGDTLKLEIRGVDNGIYTDYEFVKDNNKWFLV